MTTNKEKWAKLKAKALRCSKQQGANKYSSNHTEDDFFNMLESLVIESHCGHITSKLVDESAVLPEFDMKVAEGVMGYNSEHHGERMDIAVKNDRNEVYRVIKTMGLPSFIYIVNMLPDCGFIDLYKDTVSGDGRFDAVFVPVNA